MGKDKLRRFAENTTFRCMVQPDFEEIFNRDYKLKGRWAVDFFGNDAPIVLELGCGAGEYTVELARRHPEKNFIGIDIKGARMWRGAKTATIEVLPNVAFLRTRIEFINSFFGEGEVSEIWLTFSDPRLKAHHSQKRLTSPRFLERYAEFLAPKGIIHLKTDSAHLHHYTRHVAQLNELAVVECNEDIYKGGNTPELLSIQTAYEKRFVAEGLPITYFAFMLEGRKSFEVGEFWGDRQDGNLDERRVRKTLVEIDSHSGFCFGVVRAINAAEDFLSENEQGYSLGEIVHNKMESTRLETQGLRIITHSDMETLPAGETVVVRAHGEPPSTFRDASQYGLKIIDATCPVVASLQKKVKRAWEEMAKRGGQVVILGKKGHSEVVGLTGQVPDGGEVIVVEGVADLGGVDMSRPIVMLAQTTQSPELFEELKTHLQNNSKDPENLHIFNTICRHVAGRNPSLRSFASRYEVVIFVSGRHSSNGNVLFEMARGVNPNTYFIESAAEVKKEWVETVRTVGISGATSTPRWLMEEVRDAVWELKGGKE